MPEIVWVGRQWSTDYDGWPLGGEDIVVVFDTEEAATAWRKSDGYEFRNGRGVTAVPYITGPDAHRGGEGAGSSSDGPDTTATSGEQNV